MRSLLRYGIPNDFWTGLSNKSGLIRMPQRTTVFMFAPDAGQSAPLRTKTITAYSTCAVSAQSSRAASGVHFTDGVSHDLPMLRVLWITVSICQHHATQVGIC